MATNERIDTSLISDGYHTFGELYEHRDELFIALARLFNECPDTKGLVWRARLHSDGSSYPGWFLLGIGIKPGRQITYHLPDNRWTDTSFALTLERGPEFDGHTSADVLTRLKKL